MKNIDWTAVLDNLNEHFHDLMKQERQLDPDDERNPYTFAIFDFQEMIGSIEKEDYAHAYKLISEEFGEGYFDSFLL